MTRLDIAVVANELTTSRQRAKQLIQNGQISVNGIICQKPAFLVGENDQITLIGEDLPFVGRGGLKLEHALLQANIDLSGLVCMDIGASTGGFTDCMLRHGAAKVYAIDVGHDQLAQVLRDDARVISWEGTDIRNITPDQIKEPIGFFSIDVSFISLQFVLPSVTAFLQPDGMAVVLIKPQFEAGREHIGKHGLVLSEKVHIRVLMEQIQLFTVHDLSLRLLMPSPILGGSGNIEYLAVLHKSQSISVTPDLHEIVATAFAVRKKEKRA